MIWKETEDINGHIRTKIFASRTKTNSINLLQTYNM
jgi:hypothetical protein